MNNPALIGAAAGLVSAILFVSAAASTLLALLMVYVTPLPLMIAGLGWGIKASLTGLGVGMLVAAAAFDVNVAITYALMLAGPAALIVYLALLSRPDPQAPGGVAWYPPGRLIAWTAVMAGAIGGGSAVAIAFGHGGYDEGVRAFFNETILPALRESTGEPPGEEQIAQTVQFMSTVLPGGVAAVWLAIMLANTWLGGKIAQVSSRLIRPLPRLADMEYPRFLPIGFLLALAAVAFFAGLTSAMASAFTGAFMLAYLIMGLVVVHVITRGSNFQILILVLLYVGILVVGWLAVIVALLGVGEPLLKLRARATQSGGPPNKPRE
jgi:hypothetical protein